MTIEIVPRILKDELLRLARLDRNWFKWEPVGEAGYQGRAMYPTWMRELWMSGVDGFSMWAASIALVDGLKVFRPTKEQCAALAQIEVRLSLSEYSQPYEAVVVQLPEHIGPFWSVLCHLSPGILTCVLHSVGNLNDITTTVAIDGRPMELSLQRFDDDCKEESQYAVQALRVAVNSCLALVNYGTTTRWLLPKEVESDKRLTVKKAGTPAAERAKERLATAPSLLTFSQEVKLHESVNGGGGDGHSGREMRTHWRRGHWAMQPYGPNHSLRKRILRKPVLVRADVFLGDRADTEVIYRG